VTDQPDGIAEDSSDLPNPGRAVRRVLAFLEAWGDGLILNALGSAPDPYPLYARDLEALCRAAISVARAPEPSTELTDRIARAIGDPGSVVGRRYSPSWGIGQDGYSLEEETVTRWSTRAVLAVIAATSEADEQDSIALAEQWITAAGVWITAAGVPTTGPEVTAWFGAIGVPVPTGVRPLMHAIRRAVIDAGDAGYRLGRKTTTSEASEQ
jgi:hypothetical protein